MRNSKHYTLYITKHYTLYILYIMAVFALSGCSSTSQLGDDEQLFTGLKPIKYENYEDCDHFIRTQEEMEAALATAPNGALFGSSYYRTPFPYGLWVWNAFSQKNSVFAKWMTKSFGKQPVILQNVNPELRVSVAENTLQNHGYFRGKVDYDVVYGKWKKLKNDTVPRPRTAKIAYNVNLGHLFTIDSVSYSNFPQANYDMLMKSESLLKKGEPFDVATLDAERSRIYNLFRNHGYYFYQQAYTSYLADTLKVPGKVQMRMHMVDSLPEEATRKWVIGRVDVKIQRTSSEIITDSLNRRLLTVHFGGKKPPIRPRVILADTKMYPGQLFSQDAYAESQNRLVTKGIYSSVNFEFIPRRNPDGTFLTLSDTVKATTRDGQDRSGAGVLNMNINCVLDKPYDIALQANYLGKTSGRMGPGARLSFTKRNAFRGGEMLSFNIGANYEFQTGGGSMGLDNNYEISGDLTLTMPRLLLPNFMIPKRKRWQTTPQTMISVARETINRSGFFRRHILSGELAYTFQPSKQSYHQFSPLIVEYDRMASISADYAEKEHESPLLLAQSKDYFLSKMRYQYKYSSPQEYLHPVFASLTLTESSNLLAASYALTGRKWNEKDKTAFKTPFAQFVKVEAEWRKTWRTSEYASLIAHVQGGWMKCFGNSTSAPFSEYFYVGGANSLRAFNARTVGPGRSYNPDRKFAYITNVGDSKLVMNLEYRPRLFGSLYGALFIDMGNVWNSQASLYTPTDENVGDNPATVPQNDNKDMRFSFKNLAKDLALDVGVGIRYDLDFFVLRLDWGLALHTPYETSRSGYFNIPKFSKAQCLNFAIGYPF